MIMASYYSSSFHVIGSNWLYICTSGFLGLAAKVYVYTDPTQLILYDDTT